MNTEKNKNKELKLELYRLKQELQNNDKRINELKDENETIESEQRKFNHNIDRLENFKKFINKVKKARNLNILVFSMLSLITIISSALISLDILLTVLLILSCCTVISFKDIKKYLIDISKYLSKNMGFINDELEKNLKEKSNIQKKYLQNNLELDEIKLSQEKIKYSLEKLLVEFCNNNQVSNEVIHEMIQIAPDNFSTLSDDELNFIVGYQKVK